jgi:general secretion pathway protein D
VRVDPYAISIIPTTESSEVLAVREFKVPPDFLSGASAAAAENEEPVAVAGRSPDADYDTRLKTSARMRISAEEFFRNRGVEFPAGATASLAPGSTKLVVRNTPSALEFIEAIVEAASLEQPKQVEISAKFVEISQNNLKELGFDWTLGPFSVGGSGVYGGGGNAVGNNRAFPFVYPGTTTPVGVDTPTGGLRTGSGTQPYSAISVNSLNALLLQNLNLGLSGSGGPGPGIFSIAGIFTNPQFQVLIRALNQKKGVDLMAAPKVVAKPGQRAKINISREFPYPTEFNPPEIPQNTGGSISSSTTTAGGALLGGATLDSSDPIVTPSFPTAFTTRDLGVILEVEPQVGADGYTIELSLSPEVVDFEGFINYGSPIFAPPATSTLVGGALTSATFGLVATGERQLLTENTINQPIFSTRKVTTNVSIWDGQTVALGGLIREDIQKVSDKVPILGDIPLAGVLFRSEVEQKLKRNLIIFVTARLIDAYGQPLRPEDDSDQVDPVEPLGLPPEIPLPARENPKGLTRK